MVLDDVIAANRVWARGRSERPLADDGSVGVSVVSCYDPRLDSILAAIREAPFVPKDIFLAGALLDESTGLLEIVHRDAVSAPVPVPAEPAREVAAPVDAAAPRETGIHEPDEDAVASAVRLIDTLQSKARLRDEALRLRTEIDRASHPVEKLRLVEAFLRRAGGNAREIREAVLDLRRRAAGTPTAEIAEEVVRRLGETAREKRT